MGVKIGNLFMSRRWWLAVLSVFFVTTDSFGLHLDQEQVQLVVLTIVGWIVGDSIEKT